MRNIQKNKFRLHKLSYDLYIKRCFLGGVKYHNDVSLNYVRVIDAK